MPHVTPVSPEQFADKFWQKPNSYKFAAKEHIVPLAAAELPEAISTYPIAFIKHQDQFLMAALLSLMPGSNLFVLPSGQWAARYIPAAFNAYPFCLARISDKDEPVLCVDEASGAITGDKAQGMPFFDEGGKEPSGALKKILNFLSVINQSRKATDQATAALAAAGVLTEWKLNIQDNGKAIPVDGLYRIDETKLNALSDEQFLSLRKTPSLALAYAQLFSMGNIRIFQQLVNVRTSGQTNQPAQANTPSQPSQPEPRAKFNNLFANEDTISF